MHRIEDKTEADEWIQRETCLRMAAEIERRLLPARAPGIEGVDIAGWCMYSGMRGGDFLP